MKVTIKEDEEGRPKIEVSGNMEQPVQESSVTSSGTEHLQPPTLPPAGETGSAVASSRSEFAAVVFHEVAETYPVDSNVKCCYTLTSDITPSSRDWVGLFKVGWLSPRDYLYYEWAPVPTQYQTGTDIEMDITFPVERLPKDDGEFYQFVYVSSSGGIRGASTPFQFKRPSAEDFVELEDADSEMLIVRPKTNFLEEEIAKLNKQLHRMEQERESLVDKLRKARVRAEESVAEMEKLRSDLKEMTLATRDVTIAHDELKDKLEALEREYAELQKVAAERTMLLEDCLKKVKLLEAEKDELEGQNRSLINEMGSYKLQVSESQAVAAGYLKEIDHLSNEMDSLRVRLSKSVPSEEIERLGACLDGKTAECQAILTQLKELEEKSAISQSTINELESKNQHLEDRVEAAGEIKKIMSGEIESYQLSQAKLSLDLEVTKGQNHALKEQLQLMEVGFSEELKLIKKEAAISQKDSETLIKKLELAGQEKQMLTEQLHEAEKGMHLSQEAAASLYALQVANDSLKARHDKMSATLEEREKELANLQRLSRANEREYAKEVKDLHERISMCSQEYKLLMKENNKLHKKLAIVKEGSSSPSVRSRDASSEPEVCAVPLLQTASGCVTVVNSNCSSSVVKPEHSDTPNVEEKRKRKDKYRELYLLEKERADELRNHYYEEMEHKHTEMEKLKLNMKEYRNSKEQQIDVLKKYLVEKDRLIEELNKQICELKSEKYEVQSLPKTSYASQECTLKFANPYASHNVDSGGAPYYRCTTEEGEDNEEEYVEESVCPGIQQHGDREMEEETCTKVVPQDVVQELCCDGEEEPEVYYGALGKELPPPLQPHVLPSAKLAAIKQYVKHNYSDAQDDLFEDCVPQTQEDERFMDAIGEGMKICPVCQKHIATTEELEFAEHVVAHFGRLCPICKVQVENDMSAQSFEEHVNKCAEVVQTHSDQ